MDRRAVVIGAGITGTLVALELRKAGWDVVLLEANHVGSGSSSRTAAGIRQQFSTADTVAGMRYSVAYYHDFGEHVGRPAVALEQVGYLFLVAGDLGPVQQRVAMQHRCGLTEVELLTPPEVRERFGYVDSSAITGATWCPSDGFLHPEVIYNEAAAACRDRGVRLQLGHRVTAGRHVGGRLTAVQAGPGWIEGDLFVDATNIWSPRLADALGAASLPIASLKRYLWFVQRAGPMSAETLAGMPLIITPPGAYCRPENPNSLMAGWAHAAEPEPDFSDEDQDAIEERFFHRSGTGNMAYETWATLAEYVPDFGEFAGVTATTAGYYGTTPDHNPYLGFDPTIPNLLRLVGYSGHGAMFGPFSARVAVALAEAGGPLEEVALLDRVASLASFAPNRTFGTHEAMVI